MGRYSSGKEVADYIYRNVIPDIKECATDVKDKRDLRGRDALEAQIDCVLEKFGKVRRYKKGEE